MKAFAPAVWTMAGLLGGAAGAAEPVTIVAFGDSTTAPRVVGGKPLTVYADLLRKRLPGKGVDAVVVNAGVGGNTTLHARARFARDVLAHRPDIVILQFGINDSAVDVWRKPPETRPRVAIARYEKNLRYFIRRLRETGGRAILMTPNPLRWTTKLKAMYGKPPYRPDDPDGFNVLLRRYAEKARQIARQEKVPFIDIYAGFEAYGKTEGHSVDEILLDGMHPNAKGHRMIADLLIAQIAHVTSQDRRGGRISDPSSTRRRTATSRPRPVATSGPSRVTTARSVQPPSKRR